MTVFFVVVGLQIKREAAGDLRDPRSAALPVLAALGGMAVPALLFLLVAGHRGARGWGVPMATDIAFATSVVAVLGRRRERSGCSCWRWRWSTTSGPFS